MNVHLYGTKNFNDYPRSHKTIFKTSVIWEDSEPEVGVIYELNLREDLMIIAYPNDGATDTRVEFDFWLDGIDLTI